MISVSDRRTTLTQETAARRAGLFGHPEAFSSEDTLQGRSLITPDEVMTLHPAARVLVLAHCHPVIAWKSAYFLDRNFRDGHGRPHYGQHPHYADLPPPPAAVFTDPGTAIGALLMHYIGV